MIGNSGGAYVQHAPLPEWPSPMVANEPRPYVVTFLHNKLVTVHHYQPVTAPSSPRGRPLQRRQTKLHPPRAWT